MEGRNVLWVLGVLYLLLPVLAPGVPVLNILDGHRDSGRILGSATRMSDFNGTH